jgi:polyhydroxyalkanoate synthesis regulator phasin
MFQSEASYNSGGYKQPKYFMSNPLVHAFFVGRAVADLLYEQLEHAVTDALSELGKFDAEQRERLRQFTTEAIARAQQAEEATMQGRTSPTIVPIGSQSTDLQATIDELRAEIAQLRAELQRYRSRSV